MKANVIKQRYFPLKLFVVYITLGLLLVFYGPISYYNFNNEAVFIYMLCFLLFFIIGYFLGANKPAKYILHNSSSRRFEHVVKWLKLFLILACGMKALDLVILITQKGFNFSVTGMGEAYKDLYDGYVRGQGQHGPLYIIKLFTYFPTIASVILGVYYFKDLSVPYKICVITLFLLIFFVDTVGSGKQKQFGDLMIFGLAALYIRLSNAGSINKKKILFISSFFLLGIFMLMYILKLRYAALNIDAVNINSKAIELMSYDIEHPVFEVFGDEWGFAFSVFSHYFTGGYYGLSQSLDLPFVWTNFIGSSYSMNVLASQFFGADSVLHLTYPYRVGATTGWDETKWHSVFAWFASDFTFPGTIVLFTFVAYIYAIAWKEAIKFGNPLSVLLFCKLSLGLVYVPANNQLFHTPEGIISFVTLIILWFLFHNKFNFQTRALESK